MTNFVEMPGNVFRVENYLKTNIFLVVQWELAIDFSPGKLSKLSLPSLG